MKRKVLIIGGDSFIAGIFIRHYSELYDLKIVSRKSTGFQNEIVIENLDEIKDSHLKGTDVVINFAAIVHQANIKEKDLYDRINYKLPVLLAKKALKNGASHFIQMSTLAVYGNCDRITIHTPERAIGPYAISKLKADQKLLSLAAPNFLVLIIRPPMVYGGGLAPGNMIRLIHLIDKGYPLPFLGVQNERNFIHVANLAQCINRGIDEQASGILIPTDREAVSLHDLCLLIRAKLGVKTRFFRLPGFIIKTIGKLSPAIFNKLFGSLKIDCQEQLTKLKYNPEYTIEEGIEEMVKSYKQNKT